MLFEFLFGVICGVGLVFGLFIFGVPKAQDFLQKRLEEMANERKTKLAREVKASAKVDLYKIQAIRPVAVCMSPPCPAFDGLPLTVSVSSGVLTLSTVPKATASASFAKSAAAAAAMTNGESTVATADVKSPASAAAPEKPRVVAQIPIANIRATMSKSKKERDLLFLARKGTGEEATPTAPTLCEVVVPPSDEDNKKSAEASLSASKEASSTSTQDLLVLAPLTAAVTHITIRFFTAREAERFWTVLSPTSDSGEWQRLLKQIPGDGVLNLFLARIVCENARTAVGESNALAQFISKKITKKLDSVKLPKPFEGTLKLEHLSVGTEPPIISDVKLAGKSVTGEFGFDFNLLYPGGFTLVLLASLTLKGIKIPSIVVTVRVAELSGRIHLSIGAPPSDKMWIGFHNDPQLKIHFQQKVMTDMKFLSVLSAAVPDLSEVVTSIVKSELFEDMVLPNLDDLPIPNVADTPPSTPEDSALAPRADHQNNLDTLAPLEKRQDSNVSNVSNDNDDERRHEGRKKEEPKKETKKEAQPAATPKNSAPTTPRAAAATERSVSNPTPPSPAASEKDPLHADTAEGDADLEETREKSSKIKRAAGAVAHEVAGKIRAIRNLASRSKKKSADGENEESGSLSASRESTPQRSPTARPKVTSEGAAVPLLDAPKPSATVEEPSDDDDADPNDLGKTQPGTNATATTSAAVEEVPSATSAADAAASATGLSLSLSVASASGSAKSPRSGCATAAAAVVEEPPGPPGGDLHRVMAQSEGGGRHRHDGDEQKKPTDASVEKKPDDETKQPPPPPLQPQPQLSPQQQQPQPGAYQYQQQYRYSQAQPQWGN